MKISSVLMSSVLALACGSVSVPSLAQLSSPMPGVPGVPVGQGAGVHGANSPFPQIQDRSDVLPWSMLTDVKT